MKFLGLDYGERKIGLAIGDSESGFAEPLTVLRFDNENIVLEKILQYAKIERVDKVVMGLSEGKTAEATKTFAFKLGKKLQLPVMYQDETLTTHEAQQLAIEAGINRKKRKFKEDSYAAALILQAFLDTLQRS